MPPGSLRADFTTKPFLKGQCHSTGFHVHQAASTTWWHSAHARSLGSLFTSMHYQVLWFLLPSSGNHVILTATSILVQKSLSPLDFSDIFHLAPAHVAVTLIGGRSHPEPATACFLHQQPAVALPTFPRHLGSLPGSSPHAEAHAHTPRAPGLQPTFSFSKLLCLRQPQASTCHVASAWSTIPNLFPSQLLPHRDSDFNSVSV